VSKNHACIELTESSTDNLLNTCYLWDTNSLNKLKVNGKTLLENNIDKDKPYELHLLDEIQFCSIRFEFVQMTDAEKNDQMKRRSDLVDLSLYKKDMESFEIQNKEKNSFKDTERLIASVSKVPSVSPKAYDNLYFNVKGINKSASIFFADTESENENEEEGKETNGKDKK